MAKQSVVKMIKAKPNARGKTSHLPIKCDKCDEEALIIKGKFDNRVKLCYTCMTVQPERSNDVSVVLAKLRALGMLR